MNRFENVRVFISGGAGVIGSSLVEQLYKLGAKIFVGDLKPKPKKWPLDITYREGDLNQIELEELISFEPQVYFHLAATFERSEESFDFWQENYHHNIQLSHHLLNILKDSKTLQRIVFASSYLIYDPSLYLFDRPQERGINLKESSRIAPRNLCGMAKLLHEQELNFVTQFQKQFSVISARIYRSYGKQSRDIISRWVKALINNKEINVYHKEGIFDFIYAGDVASGLIELAKTDQSGVVNLGSGRGRKISEILEILRQYFPQMKIEEKEDHNIFIPYEASEADMTLFQTWTNQKLNISLEEAIPLLINEYKKNNRLH